MNKLFKFLYLHVDVRFYFYYHNKKKYNQTKFILAFEYRNNLK